MSGVFVSYAISQKFELFPDEYIFKTFKWVKFVDDYILNLSIWFYCVKSFNNSFNISYLQLMSQMFSLITIFHKNIPPSVILIMFYFLL